MAGEFAIPDKEEKISYSISKYGFNTVFSAIGNTFHTGTSGTRSTEVAATKDMLQIRVAVTVQDFNKRGTFLIIGV